jgi:hypothetical protein
VKTIREVKICRPIHTKGNIQIKVLENAKQFLPEYYNTSQSFSKDLQAIKEIKVL